VASPERDLDLAFSLSGASELATGKGVGVGSSLTMDNEFAIG
jgi:hypothetical protein